MNKSKIIFVVCASICVSVILAVSFNNNSQYKEEPTTNEVAEITTEEPSIVMTEAVTEVLVEETISTVRSVTQEEYQLLLRVCMSECGGKWGQPLEGKVAVVETILNRVDMGYGTIKDVITAPNQYSMANNGEPDYTVVEAVDIALSGNMYPDNMIYFRTKHYHSFGIPYKQIGNHYFSLRE